MADNKTTGKIVPRASETPTGKVKLDLMALLKIGKDSPFVYLALAVAGFMGGPDALDAMGREVPSWSIPLAVLIFGVIQMVWRVAGRVLKRLDDGERVMKELRRDVNYLQETVQMIAPPTPVPPRRIKSAGNLKSRPA